MATFRIWPETWAALRFLCPLIPTAQFPVQQVRSLGGNAPFVLHLEQHLEVLRNVPGSISHPRHQHLGESTIRKGVDSSNPSECAVAGEGQDVCVTHRASGMGDQYAGFSILCEEAGRIAELEQGRLAGLRMNHQEAVG